MNYVKENPVSIDAVIQIAQNKLFDKLNSVVSFDVYGRCYETQRNSKKIIEHSFDKKDYSRNLIVAEKNKCFFTVNPVFDVKYAGQRETNVYLFVIVDLKVIETQKTHRTDEEFVQLIESVFPFFNDLYHQKTTRGIDEVFSKYDFDYTDDLNPYAVFKFDFLAKWDVNIKYKIC